MTNTMTCDVFTQRLMPYLEDEMDAGTRAALERHAVTCVECGAILADLRKLRIDAANLPELAPSRDLWSGIAARIEAPVVPIGAAAPRNRARTRRLWQGGLLAASLAGAAALGYLAGTRPVTDAPQRVADLGGADRPASPVPAADAGATALTQVAQVAQAPVGAPSGSSARPAAARATTAAAAPASRLDEAQLVVASLTADYDREIARLNALLQTRRNQLDPVTVAIIERNLQVIDAAIAESKQAIARDPASRFLLESLNQSLQMKVELMRTAAMLPIRT